MALSDVLNWTKTRGTTRRAPNRGHQERFPTHTRVILPDGRIMFTRVADLAAAKDLLAAQRAAERRLAARREAGILDQAVRVAYAPVEDGTRQDAAR